MQFEILRKELEFSTAMIRALLAGIGQAEAQVRPSPEAWSILEVTCHLYDEEREDFREHLDFILHRQGETYHQIDPQAWISDRKYNQQDFAAVQAKFFAEREQSLTWLDSLPKVDWDTAYSSPHGSMSAGEMFASWIAHDNLHVRQLVELRRYLIEQITQPYPIGYAGDW